MRPTLSRIPLAPAAVVVTIALWTSAFVVIRSVGDAFAPGALAFVRLFVGTACLGLIALRHRGPFPRGRGLALVVGYGLVWFAAYTVLLNWAERHLDAGTAAMLVNFGPILVAVFAGFFLGEGFPRPLIIGVLVAFGGVVLIAVGSDSGSVNDSLGVLLGLITAVLYASGVVMQKFALRTVDAVSATWVGCAAGLLATLPFAPQAIGQVGDVSGGALLGAVFLGVGPTAIAFTTWAYALTRTDAGRMAATTLCVPALAVLLSWATLGEVPTTLGLVGGVLCLGGVAISRRRARPAIEPLPVVPVGADVPEAQVEHHSPAAPVSRAAS